MNDAHIYCTKEQFAQEFRAVNEMYLKYFKIFGIEKYENEDINTTQISSFTK
jgi:threonyl-tRNA synthetase